ncbi:MAG: Ig-like domain-containing protein [Chloroflexi bacterium]|nr:Ig-like domain-containing protein [Chloroflexota bacterium]
MLQLREFNHNHHPSRVKILAKNIRRGISVTLIDLGTGNYTIEASPLANLHTWNGVSHEPVTLTITADDGKLKTTATFTLTVNPVNDPPVVTADSASTDEDTPVVVEVLKNDSDIEGDSLSVSAVGSASHGSVTITGTGQTVTYTPNSNFNGTDLFTYTSSDGVGTNTASVSITINPINDAPVAVADSTSTNEDTPVTINVLANDTDVDLSTNPGYESLTIDSVGSPSHGTAEISDNKIIYTPSDNSNGSDSFSYLVRDQNGGTATGTVTLTIRPVNDYPTFSNLETAYTLDEDGSLKINFNISDIETSTESLMIQVTSGDTTKIPNSGLVIEGLGNADSDTTLTLTPIANKNGNVVITLRLGDGFVVTVATFTLHITPVNDNPVARNDTISVGEDQSVVIDMDNLIANDTDIDGDLLSFYDYSAPSLIGTLSVLDEGAKTYTYTPPANFEASTTFQYRVTDGTAFGTATVTIDTIPTNDPPTILMDGDNPSSGNEDNSITLNFTINDWETAASQLSVAAGSSNTNIVSPSNITIECSETGDCSLVATPSADKNGDVTLTVSVSDGVYLVPTEVELTFTAVDDLPSAEDDSYTIGVSGSQLLTPLENDYDVDGQTFSITSVNSSGLTGSLVNNGNGTLSYTPPSNFTGTKTFTYTITDSTGMTDTATVSLIISSVNSKPTLSRIVDQFIMEDFATDGLKFSVTDIEGDAIEITTSSSNPTLVPNNVANITIAQAVPGSGSYTIQLTPAANKFGKTTITINASDGSLTDSTTFDLTVYPVNDLPTAVTDEIITNEDTSVTFNPVTNDTDLETALSIVEMSTPVHGWLSNNGSNYTYAPFSNYNGTDTLTYIITDGESIASGTINITINSVNDNPVARNDWVTVANTTGKEESILVLGNDDAAGDTGETISLDSIITPPLFGTATIVGKAVVYKRTSEPADSRDSFVYRIADSTTPSLYATATVYIASSWVPSLNAENVWYDRNEDAATFTITLSISDGGGGGWTLELLNNSTLGTTSIPDINGKTISYTPKANAFGSETLQYKITSKSDGSKSDTANIYITLYPINDLPTLTSITDQIIDEDSSTDDLSVTINDVDDPVSELKFEIYSKNQSLVLNRDISVSRTDGSINFKITPIPNRFGNTEITLIASDSVGYTSKSFILTVNPINDAPIATDYSVSLSEDGSKNMTVFAPFADVDEDPLTITIVEAPSNGKAVIEEDKTITYTPTTNYFGADHFIYKLDDGLGGTDTGTVTITVDKVDDAPELTKLTYLQETLEDTSKDVTFSVSDIDNEMDSLTITFTSSNTTLLPTTAISMVGKTGDKTLTLQPIANLSGESIITILVSDGTLSTEQSFKLVVSPVNDLPVTVSDSVSTKEDTAKVINVVANDSDIEDSTLTVGSVITPSHGSVLNNRDGTITYTPSANWNGTDYFTYTIVDHNNGTAVGNVEVVVDPINDAPRANTDTININEDTPITISPLANDSDVESDPIRLVSFSTPKKGVLVDNGDATLTYTPNLDAIGSDSFTYVITDELLTSTGTVNINITAINDAPRLSTSADLPWTLNEDTPTSFPVHIYDPETTADNLVIRITSSDQTILPDTSILLTGSGQDKTLLLTPNLNKFGALDIEIEATDGELTTTESFPVVVTSINDLPTISTITDKSIPEDSISTAYGFTVGDIETPLADLTVTATSANGTLIPVDDIVVTNTGGANRTVQITPTNNLVGSSEITLTVHDLDGGTSSHTFTLTVTPVNDSPQANNDTKSVNEDNSIAISVLSNDTDVDLANEGDDLTIVSSADVDNGSVSIATDKKTLTFNPSANWNGTEVFTYTIRDTVGAISSASVTVTVNPVNDIPIAQNDTAITTEENNISINVLANDTDIDLSREGDVLTVLSTANVDHGTVTIASDKKSLTFNPATDWFGEETFDYTIEDQNGATASAQVTVSVDPINDPPVISDIGDQSITEDSNSGAISFTVNDVDNDPSTLSLSVTTSTGTIIPVDNIVFSGSGADQTITITPVINKNTWNKQTATNGPVLLTITVSDGLLSDSDTFYVTVTPVNDTPVANADTASTNEDQSVTITPLTNDTDVDISNEGDSLLIKSYADVDHGVVTIAEGGLSLSFAPELNWSGIEVFSYTAQDGHGATSTANITVTVNAVNDAPTIVHTSNQTIDEDTTTGAITFTINDVDNTADSLTITRTSSNATVIPLANVVIGGSGSNRTVTITPAANKNNWNKTTLINNPVTITLSIKDASLATVVDTFTVTVMKVNDTPVANNDSASVSEDGSVAIPVLTNDTDIDISNEGDSLTIVSTANVDNGSVTISGDNKSLTFTPTTNWYGMEVFDYTIRDIAGETATASVTVTVNPVNDAPTISDIANQIINEDSNTAALSFTINDIDNATDTLTLIAVTGNGTIIPLSGIVFNGSGTDRTVTVTPSLDKNTYSSGAITITITAKDAGNLTASDSFTMTVSKINDAPTALADTATVAEDSSGEILVLANDTDVDLANEGDSLTIISVAEVDNGTVNIAEDNKTLFFTPTSNWNGSETFTYTVRDVAGLQSTANVTVTVSPVNDVPVAKNDSTTTNEDSAINISVLDNDTDVDLSREGDILTIVSTTGVENGAVSIAADKLTLTFTPAANWNGSETFTYTIRDLSNATAIGNVTVTVAPINDDPHAVADTLTLSEDQSTSVEVLANDTDVDLSQEGDDLTIVGISGIDHATANIASDSKSILFTPEDHWYGIEEFSYTLQDKKAIQSSATVTITVNAANDAPVAVADSTTTTEDNAVTINVLGNDSDIDLSREGDDLTILSVNGVDHGLVTIATDKKSLTFSPSSNWNGTETFNYVVKDIANAQDTASVTVKVSPINDTPVGIDDSTSTTEDTAVMLNVIANDTDVDLANEGDNLTVISTSGVDHGVAKISSDQKSILFTPDPNWSGTEVFTYLLTDIEGKIATASVTIDVKAVNDSPVAVNDLVTINEDHSITVDVLTNDTDVDLSQEGDNILIKSVSGVDHGTVTISSDKKTLNFNPTANWNGEETFAYIIEDKIGIESTANVIVTVNPINDAPIAVADEISTNEDTPILINVLANDTDVDLSNEGDNLTVTSTSGVDHGVVSIASNYKTLTFTPTANWNGVELFYYTLRDSVGIESTAIVTVTVVPVGDVSIAVDDTASVNEDTSITLQVMENDIDADLTMEGDQLLIVSTADVDHGSVSIAADKLSLTFTPSANWTGTEIFNYSIQDIAKHSSTASVTVTVLSINDPPTAIDDIVQTNEDSPITILALANDLDIDLTYEGDTLIITSLAGVDNGTATISSDGKQIVFTPALNWSGEESFTYTMEDKEHTVSTATIMVTTLPVNNPPTLSDVTEYAITEDSSSGAISFTVADIDNPVTTLTVTAQSNNEMILPASNIVLGGSGADRTVSFTPLADKNTSLSGPITITLVVSDGSLTGSDTFTVIVTPTNDAPVAIADTGRLNEDTSLTIDVLGNDTDIDLLNEGDDLIISTISDVDHAVVKIIENGKKLLFTPTANWFGLETFNYTIQDRAGAQSSASITITVDDVAEDALIPISDPSFNILTPQGGEYYKDGKTILVSWSKVNQPGVTYHLDFYDGTQWVTLVSGITDTHFEHHLDNTRLNTNQAKYQVLATYNNPQSFLAVGDPIIIDNIAPSDVQVSLRTSDRNPYRSDTWTNLPVDVVLSGGRDLTNITLKIFEGVRLLGSDPNQIGARFSTMGIHVVSVFATDQLENQTKVGEFTIKIDNLPPAAPIISTEPIEGAFTGGTIVFHFVDDPGLSGNSILILPDNTKVKIDGDYTWNSVQDGEYTFITVDLAGNRRTLIITVTGGKKIALEQSVEVPEVAPANDGLINSPVSNQVEEDGFSGPTAAIVPSGLALLLFLFWPNVKIISTFRKKDGTLRKVTRWKRVFNLNNKNLKSRVKGAESNEIIVYRELRSRLRIFSDQSGTGTQNSESPNQEMD